MTIEQLRQVVPPPASPIEVPSDDLWDRVRRTFGDLPPDYRDFLRAYGTGCLCEFIWIFNPATPNRHLNLPAQSVELSEVFRTINASGLEPHIPIFPEPHGVLPFGTTDDGDFLVWETGGRTADWPVSIMPAREPRIAFSVGMTAFLVGVLDGSIDCDALPADLASAPRVFTPKSYGP